jgi:hypothetical protein
MEQFRAILEQWRANSTGGFYWSYVVVHLGTVFSSIWSIAVVGAHPGELESHRRAEEATTCILHVGITT